MAAWGASSSELPLPINRRKRRTSIAAARCNASVFYRRSPSGQELTIALPNQLQLSMTSTASSLAREVRYRSMISHYSSTGILQDSGKRHPYRVYVNNELDRLLATV